MLPAKPFVAAELQEAEEGSGAGFPALGWFGGAGSGQDFCGPLNSLH